MTADKFCSRADLSNIIHQKVESITTLLTEIKQHIKDDPSVYNDICSYINIVKTDFDRVINNNSFKWFLNKNNRVQNVNGNGF